MNKEKPMDSKKNQNQEELKQEEKSEQEINFDDEMAERKAELNELKKMLEDAQAKIGKLESAVEKAKKREADSEKARQAAAIEEAAKILNEAGLTEQAKKLQETLKAEDSKNAAKEREEGFEKWVNSFDPRNTENYEDEDETEPAKPESAKVTPEDWKKAEKETGYERYSDDAEQPAPEQLKPESTPDQPKPEPTPEPSPDQPKPEPSPEPAPDQPKPNGPTPEKTPEPETPKLPEQAPRIFRQEYQAEKSKGGIWGWIKERLKGFATFGFWEIHQAEKFRSRSKAESSVLQQEAKNIDQLENLDYRSAYEEAARIQEMAKQNSKNSREDYEKFSNAITAEKIQSNTTEIERIMRESVLRLQASMEKGMLQGYKTETGRSVINAENMEKYQERLRDQLLSLQSGTKAERGGAVPIDEKALRKIVRGLDKNYWRRYVYGGAEALIDLGLVSYLLAAAPAAPVPGVEKAIIDSTYTMKKGDTLWAIAKSELLKAGIPTTNANIMAGAKTLATANHVGVDVWGLAGAPLDTMMPVGTKVSLGALKAALGAL